MRRIKPLQENKQTNKKLASDFITEILREMSVLDLDVCPKKDAEEIFKLKMIVGHWLCLGVLRKLWKVCCRKTMFLGYGNTEALQKYVLEGF